MVEEGAEEASEKPEHVIEPAPSGRAKCRACQQKIEKQTLRFGAAVENAFGSGTARQYYHLLCGAERRPEQFKETLEAHQGEVPERAELMRVAHLGLEHRRLPRAARAERASSGRARCRSCREVIEKASLRIAIEYIEEGGMVSPGGFIHVACAQEYFGTTELLDRMRRASPKLEEADFTELAQTLT
jgi:hypothetical protein